MIYSLRCFIDEGYSVIVNCSGVGFIGVVFVVVSRVEVVCSLG